MTPVINVKAFKCNKCDHVWISRKYLEDGKTLPIACASCKSAYWNRESIRKRKDKENNNKK